MLIRFSLKNFLSFKDETILDMTAINAYKEHEYNLMDIGTKDKYLRVAAIYGANASGKSNLHIGFATFQTIIRKSLNNVSEEEDKIIEKHFRPFLFDKDENNTEFEIIINENGYEYKYGFEYNSERIVNEWLYRKNNETNRNTIIFERDEDNQINFGNVVRQECSVFGEQIPQETLILSFFNKLKLKTDIFNIVYVSIMDTLALDTGVYGRTYVLKKKLPQIIVEDKKKLLEFLYAIDTGIKDIGYEKKESEKKENEVYFYTKHEDANGNTYQLALHEESEGTIKSVVVFILAKLAVL